MTIEHMEPEEEPEQKLDERESRQRSYRTLANGLIIRASQFLGTFDVGSLHPALLSDWVGLATQLHTEADGPEALAERRKKYLETIRQNDHGPE